MTTDLPPESRIRVALFAGMAERAGRRQVDLPWGGGTVAELRAAVQAACPELEPLLSRSAVAIGARYAAGTDRVAVDDEVAIIPPVSGG